MWPSKALFEHTILALPGAIGEPQWVHHPVRTAQEACDIIRDHVNGISEYLHQQIGDYLYQQIGPGSAMKRLDPAKLCTDPPVSPGDPCHMVKCRRKIRTLRLNEIYYHRSWCIQMVWTAICEGGHSYKTSSYLSLKDIAVDVEMDEKKVDDASP